MQVPFDFARAGFSTALPFRSFAQDDRFLARRIGPEAGGLDSA